ncbi:MAG: Major facilitator superfamily [Parcubacteria group bacterium GW2011_GWF2_38_76]|nr:MAG: Major facilitator superfamily [Parcubacteria group bacterium GW2011_GWF2_38_76]HBM45847.1 MFS transporter [Patescibacteria group bacterium]
MQDKEEKKIFGFSRNIFSMGVVSFLNDVSSEMVFSYIPIFLTTVLGASVTFVGLIEGFADATASILKIFAGRLSDKLGKRKAMVVFGYSLSAVAKPILAIAMAPWHVLVVRFVDRVGKGTREAPRDALISSSVNKGNIGRAFGFNRGADRLGATVGLIIAFLVLPLINNNYRFLFLLSFIASAFAVLVLVVFVKEVPPREKKDGEVDIKFEFKHLGAPFVVFLIASTIFALGTVSEALIILRASGVGVPLHLLPIIYLVFNLVFSVLSVPAGSLSDKIGHRNTYMIGMLIFSFTYILFANTTSPFFIWFIFALYGVYAAFTDGVGRAIVADLVQEDRLRATAYGLYSAFTGLALLPGSLIFGFLWDKFGYETAFYYGASLGIIAFVIFAFLRYDESHVSKRLY